MMKFLMAITVLAFPDVVHGVRIGVSAIAPAPETVVTVGDEIKIIDKEDRHHGHTFKVNDIVFPCFNVFYDVQLNGKTFRFRREQFVKVCAASNATSA